MTVKKSWDFEVENINLIPLEYIKREIKGTAVREAIKNGVREIPGVRIFEKETLAVG